MDSFGRQQMNEEKRRKGGKPKTRGEKDVRIWRQRAWGLSHITRHLGESTSEYATCPQNYEVIRWNLMFIKFSQFRIDDIIIAHRRKTLFKVRYETWAGWQLCNGDGWWITTKEQGVLNTGQSDALEPQFQIHHGIIGFGKRAISRLLTKEEVKNVVRGS